MTEEEKLNELRKELNSYKINFCNFNSDFIPAIGKTLYPKKPGYYKIIRCGLSGIYQMVGEFKDGKWNPGILDGSFVVAYSRETVEIKALKLWEDKNKNKCGQQ